MKNKWHFKEKADFILKKQFLCLCSTGEKTSFHKIASKFKLFIETFQVILRCSSCHKSTTGNKVMQNYKKSKNE